MIAVALSPKARALIEAHRHARRPTAADRERVTAALRARLGTRALPLEASLRNRLITAGQLRSATAFGVCVVGSVLFLARRPSMTSAPAAQMRSKPALATPTETTTAASSEPAISAISAVSGEAAAIPPLKTAPFAPRHSPARRAAPPGSDTLAQEVALLSSATGQLASGQAERALVALEEHQRRFSAGVLSDERNAAMARALCRLRRFSEGGAALALLARGTPLAARAKEDCESASSRREKPHSSQKAESD
jgi:hypothetical protein